MPNIQHSVPMVGSWYDSENFQESFMVIDYDNSDFIGIQYKDGEIYKVDCDTWDAFHPHEIAEPEDATAPYGLESDNDDDIVKLLNEIEEQEDLANHQRHIDSDESDWQ